MPSIVSLWICISAYLSGMGWFLSAIHQLNAMGYIIVLLLGAVISWVWFRRNFPAVLAPVLWKKLRHRFGHIFPLGFLILAGMAMLGGILYPPNNFDGLTYRLPRMLHWLDAGGWHWIHVMDARLNTRACGFEWLTLPSLALFKTDRLFFLPNIISFLLLPGLIYSVFWRFGVRRRVAWYWMWLVPAGFIFALQAGGAANDLFSAIYVLAAVNFALRARESKKISDVWLSVLAAGLLTGAKASNLPLLLPWAFALGFSWRLLLTKPVQLAFVSIAAAACSFLPNAILNLKYCGDWSGAKIESQSFKVRSPVSGFFGNCFKLADQSLSPPLPILSEEHWGKQIRSLLPESFINACDRQFEVPLMKNGFGGIKTEDGAGLGFGLSLLMIVSVLAAVIIRPKKSGASSGPSREQIILIGLPWISLVVFMATMGVGQLSRLLVPYFPLIFPLLLFGGGQERVVRQRWWHWSAAAVFLMAYFVIIITPARPLFPAQTLLKQSQFKQAFIVQAETSYFENSLRNDGLGPIRSLLPSEIHTIGFVSYGNDIEPSLWRSYGRRRVEYILPTDSAAGVRQRGIQYVVIAAETLAAYPQTLDDWLKKYDAEEVGQMTIIHSYPPYIPAEWYIAKLKN